MMKQPANFLLFVLLLVGMAVNFTRAPSSVGMAVKITEAPSSVGMADALNITAGDSIRTGGRVLLQARAAAKLLTQLLKRYGPQAVKVLRFVLEEGNDTKNSTEWTVNQIVEYLNGQCFSVSRAACNNNCSYPPDYPCDIIPRNCTYYEEDPFLQCTSCDIPSNLSQPSCPISSGPDPTVFNVSSWQEEAPNGDFSYESGNDLTVTMTRTLVMNYLDEACSSLCLADYTCTPQLSHCLTFQKDPMTCTACAIGSRPYKSSASSMTSASSVLIYMFLFLPLLLFVIHV